MPAERKLVVREGDRVRDVLLVGTVTVGRSPLCEISSADPRLSREHASIEVAGAGVVVRDLGSRNGTLVNGAPVKEHHLLPGETVEVGPFVLQMVEVHEAAVDRDQSGVGNEDATVRLPPRVTAGSAQPGPRPTPPAAARMPGPPPPAATAARPAAPSPVGEDPDATRLQRRPPAAVAAPAVSAATAAPTVRVAPPPAATPVAKTSPAVPEPPGAPAAPTASQAIARAVTGSEMSFASTMLLWVMPVALLSLVAGLVPSLLEPDERTPLLQAHYAALATSAAELARMSREPALPLDDVTSALLRHTGITSARVVSPEGRVLAPMNEAGTRRELTAVQGSTRITTQDSGLVEVLVPVTTGDGRPVVVALGVDPSKIHPAPAGSAMGILSLVVCLASAWAVARKVTTVADSRLSRLGEEMELMTTRQVTVGRDPFGLRGGQRIIDAATFALSSRARRAPDDSPPQEVRAAPSGGAAATANIEADAGFRIVAADAACQSLLGVSPDAVRGMHLVDALGDEALVDEVLRLVTLATPDRAARGEVSPSGGAGRLAIEVTRQTGDRPLTICFTRL